MIAFTDFQTVRHRQSNRGNRWKGYHHLPVQPLQQTEHTAETIDGVHCATFTEITACFLWKSIDNLQSS